MSTLSHQPPAQPCPGAHRSDSTVLGAAQGVVCSAGAALASEHVSPCPGSAEDADVSRIPPGLMGHDGTR